MSEISQMLAVIVNGKWELGIGDPSFIGWFTLIAYLVTAILCVLCAQQAAIATRRYRCEYRDLDENEIPILRPRSSYSRLPRLWLLLAIILVFLGINKQLDLQTWFAITARDLAKSEGWYQQRRLYQLAFIIAIACTMFFSVTAVAIAIRDYWERVWLAVIGLGILSAFIVVRAVSFHHIDIILGFTVAEIKLNALLELAGISCITICAIKYLRWL